MPILAFAVNYCARFSSKPTYGACFCVAHILGYLSGHLTNNITYYFKFIHEMFAMSDTNWGGKDYYGRSRSGYIIFWGQGPLSWGSKLMSTIATSSMQLEYQSYYYCITELVFIRNLLQECLLTIRDPIKLFSDAKSAIQSALNAVFHALMKHVLIKYHWIRQHLQNGTFPTAFIRYIPRKYNIADAFAKQGTREDFSHAVIALHCGEFGLTLSDYEVIANTAESHQKNSK